MALVEAFCKGSTFEALLDEAAKAPEQIHASELDLAVQTPPATPTGQPIWTLPDSRDPPEERQDDRIERRTLVISRSLDLPGFDSRFDAAPCLHRPPTPNPVHRRREIRLTPDTRDVAQQRVIPSRPQFLEG